MNNCYRPQHSCSKVMFLGGTYVAGLGGMHGREAFMTGGPVWQVDGV